MEDARVIWMGMGKALKILRGKRMQNRNCKNARDEDFD
jgi:hypothetical protein